MLVAPCTGKMGGDFSTSNRGFEMAVQMGFVSMGYLGSDAEVGVPSTISVADDPAMDYPISGVVEVSCVSNFDGQPSFIDTVDFSNVGCSTTLVKIAKVSCHQSLLEQNRFSLISELVSDSFKEETLLLNWVNPTRSDKDKEDQQLMEFVPLAQWDPNRGLVLLTEEDDLVNISVEDDLEPSAWVSKKVKGFGKWVGFPIDSCERQCVKFFQRLEKV